MKLTNNSFADEQRDLFSRALMVFGFIYLLQAGFVGFFLIDWSHLSSIIFFFGFELVFIGVAFDITESLFALFAQPKITPSLSSLNKYPPVALLMTVCDDCNPSRWLTLVQDYKNYDVYILDDSEDPAERSLVDQSGYTVIRRPARHAFKAGNINYWLGIFGNRYKYFIVLDSDSLISPDFIRNLVLFAEHPANKNIGIFQSYIYPVDANTIFSKVLGSMSRLRFYIADRFANRTSLVLSWGHNQLIRIEAIRQAGGYCEEITPEDTSLSLALSQIGYSVRLVNVISYDTDPPDIFSFTRRITRWAGQTAEVFSLPWSRASLRLKLLLLYHLYTYTIHNIYLGLLVYTAWGFDSHDISPLKLIEFINSNMQVLWAWTLVLVELSILWLLQFILRIKLSRLAGITLRQFFHYVLLATALHSFTGLSTNISVLKVLSGKGIDFIPTNTKKKIRLNNSSNFLKDVLFWFLVGGIILLGMSFRNSLLFFGLNGVWVFFWVVSPFILLVFHRDQLVR